MNYFVKGLAASLLAVLAIGCGSSDGQKVEKLLNSDPNAGGSWVLVKDSTRIDKYSVFLGPDKKYHAFNVANYKEGMTPEQFKAEGTVYSDLVKSTAVERRWVVVSSTRVTSSYCPSFQYCTSYTDSWGNPYYEYEEDTYGWRNFNVSIYTDPLSGIVFEQGDSASKDLEAVAATLEEENLATIKNGLVSQFGLSESRASELASMASSMKNIADSQGRALTERDLESLQVKSMGATLSDLKKAKASGDTKAVEKMTAKAAQMNKISPEQAKRLMKQLGL